MEDPATWAIIWLAAAAILGAFEIMMAGTFFLAPFAVGALAASLVSLLTAPIWVSWIVFVVVSVVSFLALRPLARRLDSQTPEAKGIGANRMIDAVGLVTEEIPDVPGEAGMIKIGSEKWRAESSDGQTYQKGSAVVVTAVRGNRVFVRAEVTATS